jgi:hypothetical protein
MAKSSKVEFESPAPVIEEEDEKRKKTRRPLPPLVRAFGTRKPAESYGKYYPQEGAGAKAVV